MYYDPGTMLIALNILSYLIFIRTLTVYPLYSGKTEVCGCSSKCLTLPAQSRARMQSELIPFAMCQTVTLKELLINTGTSSSLVFRFGCPLVSSGMLFKNTNVEVSSCRDSGKNESTVRSRHRHFFL